MSLEAYLLWAEVFSFTFCGCQVYGSTDSPTVPDDTKLTFCVTPLLHDFFLSSLYKSSLLFFCGFFPHKSGVTVFSLG